MGFRRQSARAPGTQPGVFRKRLLLGEFAADKPDLTDSSATFRREARTGRMAGFFQAPVLILTTPDAVAPSVAVAVRATVAKAKAGLTAEERTAETSTTPRA